MNNFKNTEIEIGKEADTTRIETLKQIVINNFTKNGLLISKIKKGKTDGIFVYHQYGMPHIQNKRELIEETENARTYRRYKKEYNTSFISTENLDKFKLYLQMAIIEAKNRREQNEKIINKV